MRFELGFEGQGYRPVVHPQVFPIVSAGLEFASPVLKKNPKSKTAAVAAPASEFEYAGDVKLRMSAAQPKAFALTSKNLYWGQKDGKRENQIRFSFGRRLMGWTKVDSIWNLGQFEQLDQWDRLRPSMQGLTGIFASMRSGYFDFKMFASALFIPEIGPNVVIEDNRVVPVHPQGINSAPESMPLLNGTVPLRYQLEIPSITKILFRPSFAFSAETKPELPYGAKFSYGYLPLNYFPIGFDAEYYLANNEVPVVLQPLLFHHHLFNGELRYRLENGLEFGFAGLIDQPVGDPIPSNLTATPLTLSSTWMPWIEFKNMSSSVTLSQIWVQGGLDADVGRVASSQGSLFSSHLFYRMATQIALKHRFLPGNVHDPAISFKYIHEYSIRGDWFSGDASYRFTPDLGIYIGGDVLSSYLDVSPDRGAEFLADVRSLGRIRLGVNYAF